MAKQICNRCFEDWHTSGVLRPDGLFFCTTCEARVRQFGTPALDPPPTFQEHYGATPVEWHFDAASVKWVLDQYQEKGRHRCPTCGKKTWCFILKDKSFVCSACSKQEYENIKARYSAYCEWWRVNGPVLLRTVVTAHEYGISLSIDCTEAEARSIIAEWRKTNWQQLRVASLEQKALMNCLGISYQNNITSQTAHEKISLAEKENPTERDKERYFNEVERLKAIQKERTRIEIERLRCRLFRDANRMNEINRIETLPQEIAKLQRGRMLLKAERLIEVNQRVMELTELLRRLKSSLLGL